MTRGLETQDERTIRQLKDEIELLDTENEMLLDEIHELEIQNKLLERLVLDLTNRPMEKVNGQ